MSVSLNNNVVTGWILSYACKRKLTDVVDIILSEIEIEDIELWSGGGPLTFSYPMYGFICYVIENMKQQSVLENVELWKTCVTFLKQLYCHSFCVPMKLYISLSNKIKTLAMLQCFKDLAAGKRTSTEYMSLLNEYFPPRSKSLLLKLMETYGIESIASRQLQAITDSYRHCRVKMASIVFNYKDLDNIYIHFLTKDILKMYIELTEEMKSFVEMESLVDKSVNLENILAGTYSGNEDHCTNEVTFVKECLAINKSENMVTEKDLLLMLQLLGFHVPGEEKDIEVAAEVIIGDENEPTDSFIDVETVDSQKLIQQMAPGSSKRKAESDDDDEDECNECAVT